MTDWYSNLPAHDQALARNSPSGLAHIHTQRWPVDQRWKLYPYFEHLHREIKPKLLRGGKHMIFAPPRHGKSWFASIYIPAWYLMFFTTRNVIITSYSQDLARGFSRKAQKVVEDLGHLFGVRLHPKRTNAEEWMIQVVQPDGSWIDGGEFFSAGTGGTLPGRGAGLLIMDDVVKGQADSSPHMMQKAYEWYIGTLRTRQEPPIGGDTTMLLMMTRWAMADIGGRILEDEKDEWGLTILRALAEDDDPIGRAEGEALCPERFPAHRLEKMRDSSAEGGILFEALYQQKPMPEGGRVFLPEQLLRWEEIDGLICYGNARVPKSTLLLPFATIDPALKEAEYNDPTGFITWCLTQDGCLLMLEDHTARMRGTTDLLPLMARVRTEIPTIDFFVEDAAHGTEVIRAAEREGFRVQALKADKDKVVRGIQAQPAFAARKVYLPARGADKTVRELLENPGAKHDDRWDCVAYAVQIWRDRCRWIGGQKPIQIPKDREHDDDDDDWEDQKAAEAGKDYAGFWKP